MTDDIKVMTSLASEQEIRAYERLQELLRSSPIPQKEFLANLGLYLTRSSFSRMLFMHNLYNKILNLHGIVIEFGVRWGQHMALFSTLRTIYEPHNVSRQLVGFDTFKGFPNVTKLDGKSTDVKKGGYSVTENYDSYLTELLETQENLAPRSNIRKFELVKGDVVETLPKYLERHPETIIALAYFDLDLYEPTKFCLETIQKYLVKGSILGFDELTLGNFPGETVAVREILGLSGAPIHREPLSNYQSYVVWPGH